MTHKIETKSAVSGIVKTLIALGVLLSAFTCHKAQAAMDDTEFNECLQIFDQSPEALTTDLWHKAPLPPQAAQFENQNLYGGIVIRWISHKNKNETTTIVILVRNPEPQMDDDPDGFDVILEQHGHLSMKASVGANGFAFSKERNKGINGLLFCTRGDTSKLWMWKNNNWDVSK